MQEQPLLKPQEAAVEVVIEDTDGTAAHDARFIINVS